MEFIFRGLIKCATTDKVVTAFTKKKTYKNGDSVEWTYLRTTDPNNIAKVIYVKEEKILKEVEKVSAAMHLEPKLLNDVITYIKSSADSEQEFHTYR